SGIVAIHRILAEKRLAQQQRDLAASMNAEWARAWRVSEAAARDLLVDQGRQAWLAGDAERALVYLAEAYARGADDEGLRYLLRASSRVVEARLGTVGALREVSAVAFSPDGAEVAT